MKANNTKEMWLKDGRILGFNTKIYFYQNPFILFMSFIVYFFTIDALGIYQYVTDCLA